MILILYYKISKVGYDTNKYFITGALTRIKCKQAFKNWFLSQNFKELGWFFIDGVLIILIGKLLIKIQQKKTSYEVFFVFLFIY